jgi:hypothetical protein
MSAKSEFLRDAERVKATLAITKSDLFQTLLIHTKAEFASWGPTEAQMQGANMFERILLNMPDKGEDIAPIPSPLITHDLTAVPILHKHNAKKEKK